METRKKIIIHSLQFFQVQGIKDVAMSDISKTLGMSKKTLYVHFANKKDLVNQTITYLFDLHFSTIEAILEQEISIEKKIRKIYEYAINYIIGISPRFIIDLKKYYTSSFKDYDSFRRKIIFEIITTLLVEGQLNGEINEAINIELFCQYHLLNLDEVLIANSQLNEFSEEELLDNTIGISLKGILK
ncbi:TetR/AcrR family transcriptional regulator [Hwangdonia sp.]|uniref:TetR/AcrR family transcriptional regulator n=1 Tax=Hwangdonia sp. TaxID=1883432 RepID=UPI003AB26890